ncbi:MAG: MATE family efflux transporter [Paludibacteraceae bacterium]|nr:MATE family efflux transporter [Paludibacteraceae bacterium]
MSKKLPLTLGTEPVKKLLRAYAMPSIIAMTASSLYNMVDSIFIGHGVGELALSGLAVTFPLMNLAAAFGSLVGVGASKLISVKLGQKDYKTAQQVLGNVFVLNLIIGVCFTTLSLAFLEPILRFFGASENTLPYAKDYMTIILLGNVITHIYLGLNAVLRSSGHPRLSMYATITTVLLNAILDPIFIFVFDWGIKGAAIATILAQIIALAWQCKLFANPNELLHFHKGIFRLKKRIVMDSFSIGMAPFLMNLASCFIVILINNGLGKYGGDLAIGAYGIVNRVVFLFIMVVMGLNQGMQPIAGYNYGAQQMQRVMEVLKVTILYATMVMTLGFVVGEFMPEWVARVFTSEKELIRLAADGMRVIMFVFPVIGFQMVVSNFFQSIGMARQSIFLSLTRQVLFLIPLLIILPRYWGMTGVWISMPISDFIASVVAAGMLLHKMKNNKLHQPTM